MDRNKFSLEIDSKKTLKQIIIFSLPIAATGILQRLFSTADSVVIGQFAGSNCLAAIGATTAIIDLLIGSTLSSSIGANIMVSRYLGAGDEKRVNRSISSGIGFGGLLGILIGFLVFFFSKMILRRMNTPEQILPMSVQYLQFYSLGVPASMVYSFGTAILRAFGETRKPMLFLLLSGLINLVLNVIFVACFHLDVAGVAIATSISQYIALFLVLRTLKSFVYGEEKRQLRFFKEETVQIMQTGFPAALEAIIFSLSHIAIQTCINYFGTAAIAGHTASTNITEFIYRAMNSVYFAAVTFASQAYGMGQISKVKKIYQSCIWATLIISVPLCVLNLLFGEQLLSIYIKSTEEEFKQIIEYGMVRNAYICLTYFTAGFMEVGCAINRGMGRSWMPVIVSTVGSCLLRLIWLWTAFPQIPKIGIVYISYPVTWVITAIAQFIGFRIIYKKLAVSSVKSIIVE